MRDRIRKIAFFGLIICVTLILSYVDTLISAGIQLPGVKLGISNVVIVFVLYAYGFTQALLLGVIKSVFSLIWLGGLSGLMYSLFGIVLSIIVMTLIKKMPCFSLLSVSVAGAVAHSVGQLFAASIMLKSAYTWNLLPILAIFSCISGIVLYFPERTMINLIEKRGKINA